MGGGRNSPVILITDGWLANSGDAASYIATTESLRRALPGARVAISSHHRGLVGDRYPELDLIPPLDSIAGVRWPWTSAADIAEQDVVEALVEEADVVLTAGGGYLLERYGPEGRIKVYEELLSRGKRLMFYSQSIGRFRDAELGSRLEAVLRAADLVLVRDEPSLEIVSGQRNPENVHLTADEAFLFPSLRRVSRARSLLISASTHPWDRRDGDDELGDDSHLPALGRAVGRLLAAGAVHKVTLASTTQGFGGANLALEDDSLASHQLLSGVPAQWRNRVELFSDYLRPDEYAVIAARHTALLTMRMHGAIIAATAGTPTLLANASDKARSLSRRTGGGIGAIASREELDCIDEPLAELLAAPRKALLRQNEAVEQMRAEARRNAELVAAAL